MKMAFSKIPFAKCLWSNALKMPLSKCFKMPFSKCFWSKYLLQNAFGQNALKNAFIKMPFNKMPCWPF